ncbi:MAG: IS256 family transposase [Burkholderiales bacterium]|nr:IS256 family transposase [Burkholderiales bacterium]
MARVPASETTRKRIEAMISGDGAGVDKSELVRAAARLIVEEALEEEVSDALGREFYERGAKSGAGYRNGYRLGRLKSAEGAIEYAVPQVSDRAEPFRSKIREVIGGRSEELERLAIEMYARGLSTRDIEAAFCDETGASVLSRSAVSAVTERLWADYQAFAARDLAEFEVIYLFVDGIAERLHLGQAREAVLAAWGFTVEGKKVLLGLAPGTKEDTASGRDFLRDLKNRNLCDPLLVCSDGAPGLIRALEEAFPRSLRQRCLAHKMRNLESKVPLEKWPEAKSAAWSAYTAASPRLAELLRDEFVRSYERELPTASACFLDDFAACAAHLKLPLTHRKATRTTNLLERLFGEERRRTKVIPHAFGERAVMKLMFAALLRATQSWRGIRITEFESRQLSLLRNELNEQFAALHAPAAQPINPASRSRISSTRGT